MGTPERAFLDLPDLGLHFFRAWRNLPRPAREYTCDSNPRRMPQRLPAPLIEQENRMFRPTTRAGRPVCALLLLLAATGLAVAADQPQALDNQERRRDPLFLTATNGL